VDFLSAKLGLVCELCSAYAIGMCVCYTVCNVGIRRATTLKKG
jgi:hypothetical protein